MDENLIVLLTAVPLSDQGSARQWFQLLCDTYSEGPPGSWDDYVSALEERASSAGFDPAVARGFGDYVAGVAVDPLDRISELTQYGDTLPDWYFASAGQPATEDALTDDEGAWQAFLAENGPLWTGTEDAYPGWRDWFAYTAAERGLTEPANAFLAWLDVQEDKLAAFATYGVTIGGTAAEEPVVDPEEAMEMLDSMSAKLAELDQLDAEEVRGA